MGYKNSAMAYQQWLNENTDYFLEKTENVLKMSEKKREFLEIYGSQLITNPNQASAQFERIATQFAWVRNNEKSKSNLMGNFWIYDPQTEPLMHPVRESQLDDTLRTQTDSNMVKIR